MNELEKIKEENKSLVSDIRLLAGTEDSRLSVLSAIFIRLNNEMRLQNIQDTRKEISYSARDFGLIPERYVDSMNSIVRSYIEQINRFMKAYNDQFMNIQNVLYNAEEKQKYYFFKIREVSVMKKICELAEKPQEEYQILNQEINGYKKKLAIYEKVIAMCDKEFEECKNRREADFKELFDVSQEQALVVAVKQNPIRKLIKLIQNKFHGYENFSKTVLQKHASKINQIISNYVNRVKQDILRFSGEVKSLVGNS